MGVCGHPKESLNVIDENANVNEKKAQNGKKGKIGQKGEKGKNIHKEQKKSKEKKEPKDILITKVKKNKPQNEQNVQEGKNQKDQEKNNDIVPKGQKPRKEEKDEEKKEDNTSRNYKQKTVIENKKIEIKEIIDMKTTNINEKSKSIDKLEENEIINDEQGSNKNSNKKINLEEENISNNHQIQESIKESKKEKNENYSIVYENSGSKYIINDKNDINNNENKDSTKFINIIRQSKDDFYENQNYYIVCLRCKCRSPHIEKVNFDYNLLDINVSYYCACFFDHKCQSESLKKLINSTKPLNLCPIHSNNTLKFYCNICKKSFCEKCKGDSEEHIKNFVNFDIIISENIAEQIKILLSKTKNEAIYRKIIDDYLNNLKKNDIPKYHLKSTKNLHDNVTAIVLLQSGLIATGSYDKTIRIWNARELKCIKKVKVLEKVLALLEFKPNMLLSSNENIICLWDINPDTDKDECIHTFNGHELWVNCLVKYDDKIFVSASNDHKIIIWDYEQKKIIKIFEEHKDCIFSLIKLNDGNLCSGGADKAIIIFNWRQNKLISKLEGHKDWVKCICQIDNETILSGSDDRTIKVWKNYKCIHTIEGHSHLVKVLLKINDNYFVSGSFDNTIKIWDKKTYLCQQTLTDTSSKIFCLLKLDNNDLVSCSDDNTIKIWAKK